MFPTMICSCHCPKGWWHFLYFFGELVHIKRIGYLITEEKITIDFCKQAIFEAAKRKKKRKSIMKVLDNIDEKAKELRDMVLEEKYTPSPYSYETKIEHGKERRLTKVRLFPDQCIHHILIMLIRDKILKRIDPYAVASVPNRGQRLGVKKLEYWIQKQPKAKTKAKYCGKGDIKKCFASVRPEVIMNLYSRIVKDKKYLRLMSKVVYSCNSLPLGNYCSAWTLNLLLKDMDEAIRGHCAVHHYLRYMDDFIFLCSNKRQAKKLRNIIENELYKIKLKLKDNFQLFKIEDRGLDMMGYRVFRNYTLLRKRNFKKILKILNRMKNNKLYTVHDSQSVMSVLGQCRHCTSSFIWKLAGSMINIDMIKKIISEESRRYSYSLFGREYTPCVILA